MTVTRWSSRRSPILLVADHKRALVDDIVFGFNFAPAQFVGNNESYNVPRLQFHSAKGLISLLRAGRPVIVGIDGERSGHVLVLGGIEYEQNGNDMRVLRFRAFDPAREPPLTPWFTLYPSDIENTFDFALSIYRNRRNT